MPDKTPYSCNVQYIPPALIWKLEKLFARIRQETGYAEIFVQVADNTVKRVQIKDELLFSKVEEEYYAEQHKAA